MSNSWNKRLFNYEQDPSPGVWQQISDALDSGINLQQKLYGYQQQPPVQVWNKIETALSKNKEATGIIRKISLWKYAAAASVLAVIIGGYFLINSSNIESPISQAGQQKDETKPAAPGNIETNSNKDYSTDVTERKTNTKRSEGVIAYRQNQSKSPVRKQSNTATHAALNTERNDDVTPSTNDAIAEINEPIAMLDFTNAEKYMVYMDDNGAVAKMPKKLFSDINCPETDVPCKSKLQWLREKVSAASLTTDFGGFLQMLKHVQEN